MGALSFLACKETYEVWVASSGRFVFCAEIRVGGTNMRVVMPNVKVNLHFGVGEFWARIFARNLTATKRQVERVVRRLCADVWRKCKCAQRSCGI